MAEERTKHGGARKGAGRKPTGSTQVVLSIKLDPKILLDLRNQIPSGKRSAFVAKAIVAALE